MTNEQKAAIAVFRRFHQDVQPKVLQQAQVASVEELVTQWPAKDIALRMLIKQGVPSAQTEAEYNKELDKLETPVPIDEGRTEHAPDSLSARALDTWRRCPRLWAWLYPLGNTIPAGPSAEIGKTLHAQAARGIAMLSAEEVHPAAAIAIKELVQRTKSPRVEVWEDNGFLCGRADVVFNEEKIYNRTVVKDWKFVVDDGGEGLSPARDDGLQPEVYRQLFDAHLVEITTILADGTESNTEIAEPRPCTLAATMLDVWAAQEAGCKGLGEYGCRGKPGHNAACMLYGECPLRTACIAAGEGGHVDMRDRWDALSPAKKEYTLGLAKVSTFEELIAGMGEELVGAALDAQEQAPEPKQKRTRKAKAPKEEVPEHKCPGCGTPTPLELCTVCAMQTKPKELEIAVADDSDRNTGSAGDRGAGSGGVGGADPAVEAALAELDAHLLAKCPYDELPEDLRTQAWDRAVATNDPQTVFAAGKAGGKPVPDVIRAVLACTTPAPAWFLVKVRRWARGEE